MLITALYITSHTFTQAAQITFAFDATVTEIVDPNDVAMLLPFQPALGQSMSGKVSFTAVPISQSSPQDASIHLRFADEDFSASSLRLVTENDVFVLVGFDVQGPFDSLTVSCGINVECPQTSSSVLGIDLTYLGIGLAGGDVVSAGAPTDSPVLWNLFPSRRLLLTLSHDEASGPLMIVADVGPVRLIPEPTSALLFVLGVMPLAYRRHLMPDSIRTDHNTVGTHQPQKSSDQRICVPIVKGNSNACTMS
jgi:hypothetical protein